LQHRGKPGGLKDGEPFKHKLLMVALWAEKAKNKTFAVINESEEEQSGLEQYYDLLPG